MAAANETEQKKNKAVGKGWFVWILETYRNILLPKHLNLQKTIQVSNLLASKEPLFEGQPPANQEYFTDLQVFF